MPPSYSEVIDNPSKYDLKDWKKMEIKR